MTNPPLRSSPSTELKSASLSAPLAAGTGTTKFIAATSPMSVAIFRCHPNGLLFMMRTPLSRGGRQGQESRLEDLARHRFAEQKALHFVAAEQPEQARLLLGFDAL